MKPTVCFGEIMARLSPPGRLRLCQAMPGMLAMTFAGAEANAAATIAALGGKAEFLSVFPDNELTDACLAALRGAGIGVDRTLRRAEGRFGLYFVESGADQRAGNVVYDRDGSTFSVTPPDGYAWERLLQPAAWFHTTGISPSVSQEAAEATVAAVDAARAAGLTVSCDLNFRRKLWRWEPGTEPAELAQRTLGRFLPEVDLVTGSIADVAHAAALDWPPPGGPAGPDDAVVIARGYAERFPRTAWVAITLREGISATHNRWGALLLDARKNEIHRAPLMNGFYQPYDITSVVDRLGTGDAFAGALIFARQTPALAEPAQSLHFAVAASCLAHSISGDFNFCSRAEVETLMAGSTGGGVSR